MAKSRFSGAKYANGNHKSQKKAYNKTKKGVSLRVESAKLDKKLGGKVGDGKDAAHDSSKKKGGSLQKPSINRKSRLKIRR